MKRPPPLLKTAVITDIHYGFDTGGKLGSKGPQLMQVFAKVVGKYKPAFIVDMGDRVSSRAPERDRHHMESLMRHFNGMAVPVFHITGNHDIHHLSREENLRITGRSPESWSHDQKGFHFIFWNPHVTKDGTGLRVRPEDREWLRDNLADTKKPAILFSHAPLYHEDNPETHPHGKISIRFHHAESQKIREILERSGKVRLCMNGHLHRNHHTEINGIHYISQQSLTQVHKKHYRIPTRTWSWLEIDDNAITVKLQGKVRKDYIVPLAT